MFEAQSPESRHVQVLNILCNHEIHQVCIEIIKRISPPSRPVSSVATAGHMRVHHVYVRHFPCNCSFVFDFEIMLIFISRLKKIFNIEIFNIITCRKIISTWMKIN